MASKRCAARINVWSSTECARCCALHHSGVTWADGLRPCFLCDVNLQDLDANEETTLTTAAWRRFPCLFWVCNRWTGWSQAARCQTWETSIRVVCVPGGGDFLATANETRCPLFDPNLHLEPCVCLTINLLHALDLGVMNSFCRDGFWLLILEGACCKHASQEETVDVATHCIVHEMDACNTSPAFTCPGRSLGMFLTVRAEARAPRRVDSASGLVEALFRHRRLETEVTKMVDSGRHLLEMADILNAHGWSLPQSNRCSCFPILPAVPRSHRWTRRRPTTKALDAALLAEDQRDRPPSLVLQLAR